MFGRHLAFLLHLDQKGPGTLFSFPISRELSCREFVEPPVINDLEVLH